MKTTIKETVKNIFASNKFEDALNLTRSLRGEYIAEFGIKSWNGLVSYYKSHEVVPVTVVAEPEPEMETETGAPYSDDGFDELNEENTSAGISDNSHTEQPEVVKPDVKELKKEFNQKILEIEESLRDGGTGGFPFEAALEAFISLQDEYFSTYGITLGNKDWKKMLFYYRNTNNEASTNDDSTDEVEYMLYRNAGEKVEWFGHSENFRNLPVGATGRFIRMNNRGVSDGVVIATARMSLDHVNLFHRCYATIIRTKYSWKEQLQMAATVLTNIKDAIKDFSLVPNSDTKLVDYIINFGKKN